MKIISEISDERVLVSLKKSELANILGNYSSFDVKREFLQQVIKSETEIEVSDIYRKHALIVSLQKQGTYDKARTKLESMLNALTPVEDKIAELSKL